MSPARVAPPVSSPRSRGPRRARVCRRVLGALAAACVLLGAPRASLADDKIKDSDELNYVLKVDGKYEAGDPSPFKDEKVDALFDWRLETIADKEKSKATGQGARVMLAVSDIPASLDKDYESWLYDWQVLNASTKSRDLTEDEGKQMDELRKKIDGALSALATLPEVRGLLLKRFSKDPKAWPVVEEK